MEVNEEHSFASFGQLSDEVEIRKGMKFDNKEQVIAAVKRYSIRHHKNHRVTDSKPDLFTAVCKQKDNGCPWKIRVAKKWLSKKWEVTRYEEEHTCMAERLMTDHPKLDSNLLALEVEHLVKVDIKVKIRVLMETIHKKYRYMPSYRRTLMAKDKAIQKLYGQWDESYNRLPRFFNALLVKNPRTVVLWQHYNHSPDGTSIVYTPEDTFQRVFWSFYPCIMAFKFCRPVLCVDATFLYGKYRSTLLIASAVDAGQQIIPLAFAIVENESEATWHWFLSNIKQHLTRNRTLCVVSDRHVGLMNVMSRHRVWAEGEAFHRICARHLAANCVKNFKHKWLQGTITDLAYEYQPRKFESKLQQLKIDSPECYAYITALDACLWSAAFDGGVRYGTMTTNVAESINGVLKEVRQLPITSLVAATFGRIVQYFANRRTEFLDDRAAGHIFPERVRDIIKNWLNVATGHRVDEYNRQTGLFSVRTGNIHGGTRGGNVQVVNLSERTCSCGKFQGFRIPCSHAIAACRAVNLDYTRYVHRWYSLDMCVAAYREQFYPLGDEAYWPVYRGRTLVANAQMIRSVKGRPRSRRFHNEMDWTAGEPRPITCTICNQTGHNRRTCSTRIR